MAKALPRGVREKNGSYEARAVVNGIRINLYGTDLNELMEEFEKAKENARDTLDYRKTRITLNEWFEEWFSEVKQHRVKETSIAPMKNNFKRTFGFCLSSPCQKQSDNYNQIFFAQQSGQYNLKPKGSIRVGFRCLYPACVIAYLLM